MKPIIKKTWVIGLVVLLAMAAVAVPALARGSRPAPSGPVISQDEAKAAAVAANPGAAVTKVELESENGIQVYQVELDNGQDVLVDPTDGAILGTEQDGAEAASDLDDVQYEAEDANEAADQEGAEEVEEPGDVDNVQEEVEDQSQDGNEPDEVDEVAPADSGITADDARAIAEKAYPNATVQAIEFDHEGGIAIFEAELDNGTDVKIDATSGAIIDTDTRDAD